MKRNILSIEVSQNPTLQAYIAVMILAQYAENQQKPAQEIIHIMHSLVTKVNLDVHSNQVWLTNLGLE